MRLFVFANWKVIEQQHNQCSNPSTSGHFQTSNGSYGMHNLLRGVRVPLPRMNLPENEFSTQTSVFLGVDFEEQKKMALSPGY